MRTRSASDSAVPAGNATIVAVLARLYAFTGEERYRARAQDVAAAFAGVSSRNAMGHASLINAYEVLEAVQQIVIIGQRGEAATEVLLRAVFEASPPNRALMVVAPEAELPARHPAHGKGQVQSKPTTYLCVGTTCSLPMTTSEALSEALRRPHAPA